MPLSIPAFDQYQQPLVPVRGLWNAAPPEGDRHVNVEIDWLVTTKTTAVQFSLSGNSPVSLSQIASLVVDNTRCGSDVKFIFPDTSFQLVVAARSQGVYPVFTNALSFYANAPSCAVGDVTVVHILNSVPPPIPIIASQAQNTNAVSAISIATASSTQVIPPGINGTIGSITISLNITTTGSCQLSLVDGAGKTVWIAQYPTMPTGVIPVNVVGLSTRFTNGLSFVVTSPAGGLAGTATVNVYYSTP